MKTSIEGCYGCEALAHRVADAELRVDRLLCALTDCSKFLNDHRHGGYMHTVDLMQEREMLADYVSRVIAEVGYPDA